MVEELVESGVYVQVNAGSVVGNSGMKTKKDIKKLLQRDLVHFVGTDAHDIKVRAPLIRKTARFIEKKFGQDTAERIFHYNPAMLIKNKNYLRSTSFMETKNSKDDLEIDLGEVFP